MVTTKNRESTSDLERGLPLRTHKWSIASGRGRAPSRPLAELSGSVETKAPRRLTLPNLGPQRLPAKLVARSEPGGPLEISSRPSDPSERSVPPLFCLCEGARRPLNVFWAICASIGGLGFFSLGIASFFRVDFLFFSTPLGVNFVPQGATLTFYGVIGMILGGFNALYAAWGVGSALDVFNSAEGRTYHLRRDTIGKLGLSCSVTPAHAVRRVCLRFAGASAQIWLEIRGNAPRGALRTSLDGVARGISPSAAQCLAVRLSRLLRVPLYVDSNGPTGRS